jgi:ATP-binding cassette, subfamily F, member 3
MISVNNLSIHFTGTFLFEDVSFVVADKDRIGLVGKNGAGKTTLMRIICGTQEPESGTVIIPSGTTVGYLPQEMAFKDTGKTVFEEAIKAFAEALSVESDIRHFTAEIARREDFESESYYKLLQRLTEANDRFQILGGQDMQGNTEKILTGLGFSASDQNRQVSEFSGGWQMRVELAKILLQKPSVILLDEPTNHLDIESIQWLEDFLSSYEGAVILVSHDRIFLDNITTRTIEISLGKISDYKANYSAYEILRAERREHQISAFTNQQKSIEQSEKFIERFRYKSTKSRQVQSRIKLLDKLDRIEVEDIDKSSIHFRFPPAPSSGKVVIEAEHVTKVYGNHVVLSDLSFMIDKNDRVAFVGKNGEGKTTLSRMIIGELEYTGSCKLGHNVSIGYYAQNQSELLDPEKTVYDTIDEVAVGEVRSRIRAILGSFLFSEADILKKVKVLSGGEKSRLAIAKLLLKPVNLLVLDEPTNHLDMRSKDILKQALLHYNGTLVIVSHDRYFLHGLATKVFEFKQQKISQFMGDIYEFLNSRKIETLRQLELSAKKRPSLSEEKNSSNKVIWEKKRLLEKDARKVRTEIEKSEKMIGQVENEIAEMDRTLVDPETYKTILDSTDMYTKYNSLKKDLEKQMEFWEKLQSDLSVIEKEISELA